MITNQRQILPRLFPLDRALLGEVRERLVERPNLAWLLGGSCTGKTSVSRLIAANTGTEVLDMDTLIYGGFIASYSAERHPAARRWFTAPNPLDYALSLSWDEFDSLNRASNAEFLDLLSQRLAGRPANDVLLIEGGFTHPSVLTEVVPASSVVCLAASDEMRFEIWETAAERATMRQWVNELDDGAAKWRKFLYFDKMIAETIVAESHAADVKIIERADSNSIEEIAEQVRLSLGLSGDV